MPISTAGSRDGICGKNGSTSSSTSHLSRCSNSRPRHSRQFTRTDRLCVDRHSRFTLGNTLFFTAAWSNRPANVGNADRHNSWIWWVSESRPRYSIGNTSRCTSSAGVNFSSSSIRCTKISSIWIGSVSRMTGRRCGRMWRIYCSLSQCSAIASTLGNTNGTISGCTRSRTKHGRTRSTRTRGGSLCKASGRPR